MNNHRDVRHASYVAIAVILATVCVLATVMTSRASAVESWKTSFDEICGKVQSADSLSNQEIGILIDKADKVAPEIQRSEDPAKKVYLQRLKKCRNMYEFMRETRGGSGK